MSDDETLIDEDGIIYARDWDGHYRPRQGLLGPERDVGIFGNANIERNILGDRTAARDGLGNSIYSSDGKTLYIRTIGSASEASTTTEPSPTASEPPLSRPLSIVDIVIILLGLFGALITCLGPALIIGPIVFAGWIMWRGWKSTSNRIKWIWVASWFVCGINFQVNSFHWFAIIYYVIGVIAGVFVARDKNK